MDSVNSYTLIPGTTANCYDVSIEGKRFLIDAGMKGSGKKIIAYYDKLRSKPDIVLVTHYHPDHIGGLEQIKNKYGCTVYVPDGEVGVVKGETKMTPIKGFLPKLVSRLAKSKPVKDIKKTSELNNESIEVISTPGHTPDSKSYYFRQIHGIFVGDSALKTKNGIGVNKRFTLDQEKANASIKVLSKYKNVTIYPGHGRPFKMNED
jgi:glyoxylase-like metal-dependent hydrolase (beta-lactamase superfamily II)